MLFLRAHSLVWGIAYAVCAAILYSRPIFNSSPLLPLLFVIIALPFTTHPDQLFFRIAFAGIMAVTFGVVVSVKNLILTHRDFWVYCAAYCLAYLSFLSFFAYSPAGPFLILWIFTLFLLVCALTVAVRDVRLAFPAACVLGELIWVVSWLPIGALSSANLSFLAFLSVTDTLHEGHLAFRRAVLFAALCGVIAASSYWRL